MTQGVQLAKNDGSVCWFNYFTLICQSHFSFMPLRYDSRNDVLLCWIGPTNYQPKWI